MPLPFSRSIGAGSGQATNSGWPTSTKVGGYLICVCLFGGGGCGGVQSDPHPGWGIRNVSSRPVAWSISQLWHKCLPGREANQTGFPPVKNV